MLSVISYQLSVISYQLSVISYQLSVISYQLSVISYSRSQESGVESWGFRVLGFWGFGVLVEIPPFSHYPY
ncbi:MAG: hypothetical protein ACKO2T_25070, partial [Microcystis aeruginosa]